MTKTRARNSSRWILCLLCAGFLLGCDELEPRQPPPEPAENVYVDELGGPLPSASAEQKETFRRGLDVMARRFDAESGLGPDFNVTFCGACHEQPVAGGSAPRYRNFLLVHSELSDGSSTPVGKNGIQTQFDIAGTRHGTAEGANRFSTRNSIPFFGTGLLAELPESSILAYADPDDSDGDGISGRPNYDDTFVGRFGRKAQTVSIEGFIRGPLFNHLGITTVPLSNELKAQLPVPSALDDDMLRELAAGGWFRTVEQAQAAAPDEPTVDEDGVPDPELSEQELFDLVSMAMLLAPPRPAPATPDSEAGEQLFADARCDACHVPALEGPRGLIFPYSDLLLHDMGPEMDDGVRMGVAESSEFRTQPLWGIAPVGPFLHDGRADTLDDAIRWHGGEAEGSRLAYEAMTEAEQRQLQTFLISLGGAEQASEGLIPPGEPVPDVGLAGGPRRTLTDNEALVFETGRAVFDRDVAQSAGLGPRFNGDSCRACHFDPVVGGSGPAGVNVTRHGIIDTSTMAFTAPAQGTMAHRFMIGDERPPADPTANVTELRQTPSILGLGLLERVDDAAVIASADPDDADGDGISGRAHVLADGRVGKLGWKADVPSLEEFTRDAMGAEVGVTVPARDGATFGATADDDAWPDPELSDADYDAIIFYMQELAPPARSSVDGVLEAQGEALFAQVGCDGCHLPTLTTSDGQSFAPYTDLLLHDIAKPESLGIESGDASIHEFRTAPLWGIGSTGPYMHHGLAGTLDAAIREHFGEADASRAAYEALDEAEREALLAFLNSL